MPSIACPLCLGPVEVTPDAASCALEGHSFAPEELVRALQGRVDNALWAAIRSLEDEAAFARLREREGRPVPVGAAVADEHVESLRRLLRSRAQELSRTLT